MTDWHRRFLDLSKHISGWSTCERTAVACVLVRDKRILATGYNGAPSGHPHCGQLGCLRAEALTGHGYDNCRAVHAEQNAVAYAARYGVSLDGATAYITRGPCVTCAKLLVQVGVREVYLPEGAKAYPLAEELINGCGGRVSTW